MRNRLAIGALAILGCLLLAPVVFGQDAGGNPPTPPPPPPAPREGGPINVIKDTVAKLGLTDDQSKQVNDLIAKFQADMKANYEKNGDALRQLETDIKAAKEAGDKAKIQDLQAQRAKLLPDMRAKTEDLVKQIKSILTDEQGKKFDAALKEAFQKQPGPPPPGGIVERILKQADTYKLTDEQKSKIQDLLKAYQDAMKNAQGADGEKTRKDLGAKLLTDVKALLTADQVAMAEKMFAPPPPREAGLAKALSQLTLTDDQKAKLADLKGKLQDAMKNAASKDDRRALGQKYMQDVENLLTADQKDQVRKIMSSPGDGSKGPGPGGDRPKGGDRPNTNPPAEPPPAGPSSGPPPL